jgi:hypothetical protein
VREVVSRSVPPLVSAAARQPKRPGHYTFAPWLVNRADEHFAWLPAAFRSRRHVVGGAGNRATTERYTHVATLQMKYASERIAETLWGQG